MSDTALNAMKRTALVLCCLMLVAALGVVFTRVVAARVPEQRATLEKLITDRTGLAVRFENVHLAWGLDGTSAVFTRVELTDSKAGRVRVVAPELRVEFDTWDFLRHQQFSLGHVTLSSPDIEIIGDPEPSAAASAPAPGRRAPRAAPARDEAALVRRVASWAQLMPNGRIEVEGARVHLLQRGHSLSDRRAQGQTFTLSQAVISRGASNFNAYGTMLLAQDVGQSLFVSAKLENLAANSRVSGELRVIARRVFLDKLPLAGPSGGALRGRGTFDAKLLLRDGLVAGGSGHASARELGFDEQGPRFDHLTVSGSLSRESGDVLLELSDLQLTRGSRLERAPRLVARLALEPGGLRIARTTVQAERLPFMGVELVAAALAPQLAASLPTPADGWAATAGELHDLRFDSGERRAHPDAWTFSARMAGGEFSRNADHARLAHVAARLELDAHSLSLAFDPRAAASVQLGLLSEPRPLVIGGSVTLARGAAPGTLLRFDGLRLASGDATVDATGEWSQGPQSKPLVLSLTSVDRDLVADAWRLARGNAPEPTLLGRLATARVVTGTATLAAAATQGGATEIAWDRSRGRLELDGLATAGEGARLSDAKGSIAFARGAAQLRLGSGRVDDLVLTAARLDWPARGEPRLTTSLSGSASSAALRPVLAAQGLANITGDVSFDADARGVEALSRPQLWRISARLEGAEIPLARGVPPLERLSGSLRVANGELRALSLAGTWMDGPVEIEARRAARGALALAMDGSADVSRVLRTLGSGTAIRDVSGQVAWTGTATRSAAPDEGWQLSLASNLVGLESALPDPLGKSRARALPVSADLALDAGGIHAFQIDGRDFSVRGESRDGALTARFTVPGAEGTLRRSADDAAPLVMAVDRLETRRAPSVLAAAAAWLPPRGEAALDVADLRHAERSLGAVRTRLVRTDDGVAFSLDSAEPALHRLSAQGTCRSTDARCRAEFTADTRHLAALLGGARFPADLPAEKLHASGELAWSLRNGDLANLEGRFDLETEGVDAGHQLVANATLAEGQLRLDDVQGSGPAADQVFRGSGRVGLVAHDYDVTVDYERLAVATAAVPTPTRARLARAWSALRGSAARRGWAEEPEARRVQWHGYWDREATAPEVDAAR